MISSQTPKLVRNPNFLARAIFWSVVVALWGFVTIVSAFALGWWMLVLLAGGILWTGYRIAAWWMTKLRIDAHAVTITDLDGSTAVAWDEIERFEILEPGRRTPFMLSFAWWRDRARLRLRDGTVLPIRAIQPWHDGTMFGQPSLMKGDRNADRQVDALNRLVEQRGSRR